MTTWISDRIADLDRYSYPGRGARAALARHLGVHPSVVTKIIAGVRPVRLSEVALIESFFGRQSPLRRRESASRQEDADYAPAD